MTYTRVPAQLPRPRLAAVAVAVAALIGAGAASDVGATGPVQRVAEVGAAQRVRFAPGTDHATVTGALGDGVSDRFVLRAGAGQHLTVTGLGALHVGVTAPDGSLLPGGPGDTITFGLPVSGDYTVEVMPGMGEQTTYQVTFTIPAVARGAAPIRVEFPRGTFGTAVSGRVHGGELVRYLLWAAPGRTMTVLLDADRAAARFSVLAPDGSVLAGEQTAASVSLPAPGDYTVAVWSVDGDPAYDVSFDIR